MSNLSFDALAGAVVAAYSGRDSCFPSRVAFWVEYFGDRDVTTICNDDIEDGIDALVKRGKTQVKTPWTNGQRRVTRVASSQPISPSTVNRYVSALGTAFKEARRMRLLPRGFATPMRGVTRMEEGAGRTLSVTVADVQRLVAACRVSRNPKLAALVAMACTTGWRKGTLEGLAWGQIDLKAGHADTLRTKNGTPHRTPLLPWVADELRRIRPELARPMDPIFGAHHIEKAWKTALKRADLPQEWTFHHCRHIAASILAQSGASTVTIMQALNHKTPMMALRYSHLNTDALRESLGRAWQ
jgi:integrase